MTAENISFEIPPEAEAERVLTDIVGDEGLVLDPARRVDELYLDTRDGRLFCRGAALCAVMTEGRCTSIRLDHEGTAICGALTDGTPRFAWEIHQDALRRALDALVADRELRPLVRLRGERRRFLVGQGAEGARATGWIERATAAVPGGGEAIAMPTRIVVHREQDPPPERFVARFTSFAGARRATPRLARALERTGVVLGGRRSAALAIRAGMPALLALRLVHRGLLDRILECLPVVREGVDPEAVHDLRVSIRRTRAALGQIRQVYPERARAHFRAELGWLARATGEARDLDVFMAWLRRFQWESPARLAEALQPLIRHLQRARRETQARMVEQLVSPRCSDLVEGWESFLETVERADSGSNADRPIEQLVCRRFARALARTRELAARLGPRPEVDDVHRLRLAAKRARYLIDLFEPLHAADITEDLSPAFRSLQDALGDHHDASLQEQRVLAFSESLAGERGNAPTVLALGRLVGELGRRQSAILRTLPQLLEPLGREPKRPPGR